VVHFKPTKNFANSLLELIYYKTVLNKTTGKQRTRYLFTENTKVSTNVQIAGKSKMYFRIITKQFTILFSFSRKC